MATGLVNVHINIALQLFNLKVGFLRIKSTFNAEIVSFPEYGVCSQIV